MTAVVASDEFLAAWLYSYVEECVLNQQRDKVAEAIQVALAGISHETQFQLMELMVLMKDHPGKAVAFSSEQSKAFFKLITAIGKTVSQG